MGSSSTTRNSSDEGLMMGGRYLSKEVVCKILGKLPVRSFIQLRSVCKRWHSIMNDMEFQSISSTFEIQNSTNLSRSSTPFLLWDANSSRPLMSFDMRSRQWRTFQVLNSLGASVVSSTKGLFLTVQQTLEGKNVFVVNPLTRVERQIPNLNWADFEVRQMVVDEVNLGQYFIIAEELQKRITNGVLTPQRPRVQIYDSSTRLWFMTGGFPEYLRFKNAFALNGHLLFVAQNSSAVESRNVAICKFDGASSIDPYGLDVPVFIGPKFRQWIPRLFGSRGRLMLIGETETHNNKGVFIWELNPATYEWEFRHEMPRQFFEDSIGSYDFLASDDYVCVHPSRRERNKAIIGDLCSERWHVLPFISPSLCGGRLISIIDSFCFFEPRVGALV